MNFSNATFKSLAIQCTLFALFRCFVVLYKYHFCVPAEFGSVVFCFKLEHVTHCHCKNTLAMVIKWFTRLRRLAHYPAEQPKWLRSPTFGDFTYWEGKKTKIFLKLLEKEILWTKRTLHKSPILSQTKRHWLLQNTKLRQLRRSLFLICYAVQDSFKLIFIIYFHEAKHSYIFKKYILSALMQSHTQFNIIISFHNTAIWIIVQNAKKKIPICESLS